MYRLVPVTLALLILFSGTVALAALPPAYYTPNGNPEQQCTVSAPCGTQGKTITFYVPHGGVDCASSIEGCIETSKVGLDGTNKPIPVDAVRLGKAKYATCASDPSNYGKYFNMGTITYRSALDQQKYTVENLICYVHDTGGAFKGRPDKLDLATTICPTCTDAQAGAIGVGGQVNVAGQGALDTNRNASIFNSALANMGLTPANLGTATGNGYNQQASNPFSQAISRLMAPTPPPPLPAQSQPALPIQNPLNPQSGTSTPFSATQTSSVALLVVQPQTVHHNDPILVSWTSVGMDPQSLCQVSEDGQNIAQKNSGSQVLTTSLVQVGTLTFTLSCTTQAGAQVNQTASVSVL